MPITNALLAFGKWVAIFDGSGTVRWGWFADPLKETLGGMQEGDNRQFLAEAMKEIVTMAGLQAPGASGDDGRAFGATPFKWEPFHIAGVAGVGFTWTDKTSDVLDLGIGAEVAIPAGGSQVKLNVLAQLLNIANKNIASRAGNVVFNGSFPVPDFLTSGSINGEVKKGSPFKLELQADRPPINGAINSRKLEWTSPVLVWDAARLAMFILEAWVRSKATPPNGTDFFSRVEEHLFPMFGEPPGGPIGVFPLFQPQKENPNFAAWSSTVLTLGGDAQGALTFIWHLRALLTGNESSSFLNGSVYFPLHGNPTSGTVPTLANATGNYPANATAPGAWLGIKDIPNGFQLLLILKSATQTAELPLGQVVSGTVTLPKQPSAVAALKLVGNIALSTSPAKSIKVQSAPDSVTVTLFEESVADQPFPGVYAGKINIANDGTIRFLASLPSGDIPLPPATQPEQIAGMVVDWVLRGTASLAGSKGGPIITAMADLIKAAIQGNIGAPQVLPLIGAITGAIGPAAKIEIDPLTITFGTDVTAALDFRNLKFDQVPGALVHIKRTQAEVAFALASGAVSSVKFAVTDLRLAKPGGSNNTGLIAELLPDLTQAPGFDLKVSGPPNNIKVEGGGKVPIQRSIGPLDLTALLVQVTQASLTLGIDLTFLLGPVVVSVYELGVEIEYSGGKVTPFLHGLALSLDADVVKLQGFFGEVKKNNQPSEYIGGAVVSVAGMFELTAIGGYSQTPAGDASMFIFASLVAPLGGPPWFFITGIAGGFGFNRKLPPPGLLYDHPFLQVMAGKIDLTGGTEALLVRLSEYFAVTQDTYWIAGGIQFVSFGFIYGKVVIAIQFGHSFAISVLGMAAFGISPLAYFEIAIEASADQERFLLKAGISPNSYIIHPDIFSLRGDFGLGVWYDGDFVFSIGGFHPNYNTPSRYRDLNLTRVGVKALVWGFVRMSVECFFACTPQALMAGASVTLAADFEGIAAGLDVYVDVLITWDPFFIWARMGVTVWFEFLGRHEVGVDLEIWTPPFGGVATIDLAIVSFDVDFGSSRHRLDPPGIAEFATNQLGVPATGETKAKMSRYNTDDAAGLIRVDITEGRISHDTTLKKNSKQEGLVTPISVNPEFAYTVTTRLPFKVESQNMVPDSLTIVGETDLPLCEEMNMPASLTVTAEKLTSAKRDLLYDFFPAAEFGETLKSAQASDPDARSQIASIKTDEPTVELTDGLQARYVPNIQPSGLLTTRLNASEFEPPDPDEIYPLPFKWTGNTGQVFRNPKWQLMVADISPNINVASRATVLPRRIAAYQAAQKRALRPVSITTRTGVFGRPLTATRLRGILVATVPAGTPVMAPPPSPQRMPELFGVTLRTTAPHAAAAIRRPSKAGPTGIRPSALTKLKASSAALKAAARAVAAPARTKQITLAPGSAGEFIVSGDRIKRLALAIAGGQMVRAVCLTSGGQPVGDLYVVAGQAGILPPRTRNVIVTCEGAWVPGAAGPPPVTSEVCGIERDSTLLTVGDRTFAGKGCLVWLRGPMDDEPAPLEDVPGHDVLYSAARVHVRFPAPAKDGSTLIITVAARVADPESAVESVRWRTEDGTFADLFTVIDAGRVAFLMRPLCSDAWTLEIDLGREWRLDGVVLSPGIPRDHANKFRRDPDWDLIDDRFDAQPAGVTVTATLEVVQ